MNNRVKINSGVTKPNNYFNIFLQVLFSIKITMVLIKFLK